jgi:ornithine cyclodeaminase
MATVVLTARDVRAALSMRDAIGAVGEALRELAVGAFEQPPRTVLGGGRFLVMSAHHRPTASTMVKTLSLEFRRVPAIVGTVTFTDLASADVLVADAAAVTALRTGAIVGVATDLLAPATADRMVLIGVGGQAADQVRAVHTVRPLRSLVVVGRDAGKAERFLDGLAGELDGVDARVTTSVSEAVRDAEIVCCATSTTTPLFAAEALPARVHVNAIGSFRPTMRELPTEVLAGATVVVDQKAAVLEESGEILDAIAGGAITEDRLIELGAALIEADQSPLSPSRRTVFKTVGIAVQDWAIARLLAARATSPMPQSTADTGQGA